MGIFSPQPSPPTTPTPGGHTSKDRNGQTIPPKLEAPHFQTKQNDSPNEQDKYNKSYNKYLSSTYVPSNEYNDRPNSNTPYLQQINFNYLKADTPHPPTPATPFHTTLHTTLHENKNEKKETTIDESIEKETERKLINCKINDYLTNERNINDNADILKHE